jgi:multidrug efflux pump subunit AcrA (membrane-fusion protein)
MRRFLVICLLLSACQAKVEAPVTSLPMTRQDFAHIIVSQGELIPVVQETLSVPRRVSGTLELLLPQGQQVKKGTVVARVSTRAAQERMAGFTERFEQEQATLQKQRAELPLQRLQRQADVRTKEREAKNQKLAAEIVKEGPRLDERVQAQVNLALPTLRESAYPLAETEALYAKGYLAEQELLTARQEYAAIKTDRETAALSLKQQTQTYRQPEIKAADLTARTAALDARITKLQVQAEQGLERTRTRNQGSRVESFQRRTSSMQDRLRGGDLRAPFDGVVLYPRIMGEDEPYVGMQVFGGLPVVQVARVDQLKVLVRVDEFEIAAIHKDLPVTLTSPGFPGKVYQAKVTRVDTLAKYKDEDKPVGIKYFDVEIALVKKVNELRANMSIEARIQAQTLKNVWTVPLESLVSKGQQTLLRLEENGQVVQRPIEVLARSEDFAAIKGTFTGKERVVISQEAAS